MIALSLLKKWEKCLPEHILSPVLVHGLDSYNPLGHPRLHTRNKSKVWADKFLLFTKSGCIVICILLLSHPVHVPIPYAEVQFWRDLSLESKSKSSDVPYPNFVYPCPYADFYNPVNEVMSLLSVFMKHVTSMRPTCCLMACAQANAAAVLSASHHSSTRVQHSPAITQSSLPVNNWLINICWPSLDFLSGLLSLWLIRAASAICALRQGQP